MEEQEEEEEEEEEVVVEFEQRRQGEEEQVVYCAVGKEAGREWKANLLWVLANLPRGKRLVFVHLHRPASRINMMGAWVPVSQLAEQEVTAYRQLEEGKIGKVLDDLLDICKSQKVNASKVIIGSDDTARGLVQFVDDHGVTELVMGAASDRAYHRKMRAPRSKKALMVQRRSNPSCKIWFVCKGNLICTREASEGAHRAESSTTGSTSPRSSISDYYSRSRSKSSPRVHSETQESSVDTKAPDNAMDRTVEDSNHQATDGAGSSKASTSETAPEEEAAGVQLVREVEDDQQEIGASPSPDGSEEDGALYEKLKDAIMEAANLKHEAYEETRRRQMAERDLAEANKMAAEAESSYQREAKHRKEVEEMLARERAEMERDMQELNDMLEQIRKVDDRSAELETQMASSERMMSDLEARLSESYGILDTLTASSAPRRSETSDEHQEQAFRRLDYSEVDEATSHFDESLRIDDGGDGGRGKVYRGRLGNNNMAVAVKVLSPDVAVSSEAVFRREVEALGRASLGHPGIVKLVGACPEARAVVYELVPGGSLERRLEEEEGLLLPWHVRCVVAHRTCSALAFLHSSTRTVHGDLRPANILLTRPLRESETSSSSSSPICKLGGLGTRRLVEHPARSRSRRAAAAYADPHYLATGELTPHCDVYSLGVVLLRLVTGRPPFLARKAAQEAAAGIKEWHHVVDRGVWPVVDRAREVALVGLKCCRDTREQRPGDMLEEAMSVLEEAMSDPPGRSPADAEGAPSYFLCPILKEVMRDPQIAGDGFSYEAEAIKEWLDTGHDTSPMTNLKLPTRDLTPNHALRSAIHDWRQRHQLDHY